MVQIAAKVCATILLITLFSVQCYSLNINFKHEVNNYLYNDEDASAPEAVNYADTPYEKPDTELLKLSRDDLLKLLFAGNFNKPNYDSVKNEIDDEPQSNELQEVRSRRQAYNGQAPLYPKLPSSSPYNQYQQNTNYNNQHPPYNQYQPNTNYNNQNTQWQPHNNNSQAGYPSNSFSNFNPSTQRNTTYGHQSYNPNQPQYPSYNNAGQRPINGQYNSSFSPYPGYRAPNSTVHNAGSSRPPYNQHGQINNNPYQNQLPPYPPTTPAYRQPVYGNTSKRPTYINNSSSNWPGNQFNHSSRQPPNASNGHNPQYFNSYPNNRHFQPNQTYPHNVPTQRPYHNAPNGYNSGNTSVRPGQYPPYNNTNTWSGHHTSASVGGSPYGQNPQNFNSYTQRPTQNNNQNNYYPTGTTFPSKPYSSIPNQPPYGGVPGQNQYQYPPGNNGAAHDPTKVSPEYFSYPH